MPSLPIELFGLISCYAQERATLYSLLLTSRAFNYYAEKILYRDVKLTVAGLNSLITEIHLRASHLASCKRVAVYVQSLTVNPYVLSTEQIQNVLRATVNLTSLSIQYDGSQDPLLSNLTDGASFKLKSLDIASYDQQDLKDFIHSQQQISSFLWRPGDNTSNKFPTVSDLSNITTLDSTPEFLEYILSHCQLRRLHLSRVFILTNSIPSLEVFSSLYLDVACPLATLFPNLRYLEACLSSEFQLLQYLQISFPPRIEVLRILIHLPSAILGINSQTLFDYARRPFENNPHLWLVEMGCKRGFREVTGVKIRFLGEKKQRRDEIFRLDAWDWTEWMRW